MTVSRFFLIFGSAIVVMAVNVAIFYLWVVIYSYLIDKGHDEEYYREYAQRTAPYSSMIVGFPLMIVAAWILGSRWEPEFAMTAALVLWASYTVVDVLIVAASKPSRKLWIQAAVSQTIKLSGAVIGALLV